MRPLERIPGPEWETLFLERYRLPIHFGMVGSLVLAHRGSGGDQQPGSVRSGV
jgi:hypothetical protein